MIVCKFAPSIFGHLFIRWLNFSSGNLPSGQRPVTVLQVVVLSVQLQVPRQLIPHVFQLHSAEGGGRGREGGREGRRER